jgi:hypothetical protein
MQFGEEKNKTISFKRITHDFCGISFYVFNAPTLEELKQSDLPDLVDMLSKQATEYSRMIKIEGITSKNHCHKRIDP